MQYENDKLLDAAKGYIELMKESGLGYFRIRNDKFEIELGEKVAPLMMPASQIPGGFPPPLCPPPPPPAPGAPASAETPDKKRELSGNIMKSPIVGTFYASSAPEKPPYVTVGKEVHKGDVLFIIESMKLMNEVTSEFDGVVAEIYVEDGEAVEFGQPIMRIE